MIRFYKYVALLYCSVASRFTIVLQSPVCRRVLMLSHCPRLPVQGVINSLMLCFYCKPSPFSSFPRWSVGATLPGDGTADWCEYETRVLPHSLISYPHSGWVDEVVRISTCPPPLFARCKLACASSWPHDKGQLREGLFLRALRMQLRQDFFVLCFILLCTWNLMVI